MVPLCRGRRRIVLGTRQHKAVDCLKQEMGETKLFNSRSDVSGSIHSVTQKTFWAPTMCQAVLQTRTQPPLGKQAERPAHVKSVLCAGEVDSWASLTHVENDDTGCSGKKARTGSSRLF